VVVDHVLEREVVADQRPLHHHHGDGGGTERHPHVRQPATEQVGPAPGQAEGGGTGAGDAGQEAEQDGALAEQGAHGALW
jgi:hypothetical protein